MPEDRKKLLEALVAKRKAEAESGGRKKPTPSSFSKPLNKTAKEKPKAPSLHVKKHQQQESIKKQQQKKKPRVERYESEGSDEEDEESEESEDEPAPKPSKPAVNVKAVKGKTPLKHDSKGSKEIGKGKEKTTKGKEKPKRRDSSEDEGIEDEEEGSDVSEDPLKDIDVSNIISEGRGRRNRAVRYDFGNASDDDDDDSDD